MKRIDLFSSRRKRFGLLSVLAFLLVGCASSTEGYKSPELDLPAVPQDVKQTISNVSWWESFGDPVLNALVQEALRSNWDLLKTNAKLNEARASLASVNALTTPRLDGAVSTSSSRRKLGDNTTLQEFNGTTRTTKLGVSMSWELDLWGRVAHLNEAAQARWASSELMQEATQLSVASTVTEAYFQWRTLQDKLAMTQSAVAQLQSICDLEQRRWQAGLATELVYRQSLAELVSFQAKLPQLEEAIGKSELALQVLVGRAPREIGQRFALGASSIKVPAIPPVLDTQLLLRRPDVAAAEWSLKAAYSDVNVSRAERYPRLNLSLIGGLLNSSSNWVTGTPTWIDVGLGASAPIWDGGLTASKIDANVARRDYAKAQYHQAVLQAYRDLYEALLVQRSSDQHLGLLQNELNSRQKSLSLTQKSHDAGRSSQYEVLSEKIKVLQVQLELSDAQQAQWLSRSRFYKAVGGSL